MRMKQLADVNEDTERMVTALLDGGCYCLLRQWIIEDIPKTLSGSLLSCAM